MWPHKSSTFPVFFCIFQTPLRELIKSLTSHSEPKGQSVVTAHVTTADVIQMKEIVIVSDLLFTDLEFLIWIKCATWDTPETKTGTPMPQGHYVYFHFFFLVVI